MPHIPVLRAGKPYQSLNRITLSHIRTGEPIAEVSQANRGLIVRDLSASAERKRVLEKFPVSDLIAIGKDAARLFMEEDLPLGEDTQSPDDYVRQLSATTGMPESLCRANMRKIKTVLVEMESVLGGLTRGLDLSILDSGWGVQDGRSLSYLCQTRALGAVLPSNSPGVHSLWLPSIPLKVPVVLKPGSDEPWTPFRVVQAFIAAGCPSEAFGLYPTDYAGATEVLLRTNRSILFGGESTVAPWRTDPSVQIHGPGWSKILIAEDGISQWEGALDLIVTSVAENGGRSCINASGVWVPSHGREVADTLAQRLARIDARPLDHPEAKLAAFRNVKLAARMAEMIERQLKIPGAEDLTTRHRGSGLLAEVDGCTFLLPTVIWCEDPEHPLANTEFLFPFVSVVQTPQSEMLHRIGSTLVATVLTEDPEFTHELLASPHVERLNLGPIPTNRISWDQPHEGNLFEHLYQQRAFQKKQTNSDLQHL